MNEKKYRQRTKVLGIPVVGHGDSIWPETELVKYQIIENMLMAGTRGVKNCLFEEGDLKLERNADGEFSVVLRATGSLPCAVGLIGGVYFDAPSRLEWGGLKAGKQYFLYLIASPKTIVEPSLVRTISSEFEKKDMAKSAILISIADLRGETPVLDRYPDGKLYAKDLARHVSDSENPHGESMEQDELIIRKNLVLDAQNGAGLTIRTEQGSATLSAASLVPRVLECVSGGVKGTSLSAGGKVGFVMVGRMSGGQDGLKLGETYVGYYGADTSVVDESSFVVYNTGDTAIPLRVVIFYK